MPAPSRPLLVAIDFGISCTDIVSMEMGADPMHAKHCLTHSYGKLQAEHVTRVLATAGLQGQRLAAIAVTGGHSSLLPETWQDVPLRHIHELEAIGDIVRAATAEGKVTLPCLGMSCGTGTAMVRVTADTSTHVGGTALGGGTLMALARLCVQCSAPPHFDALARAGNARKVNLSIGEATSSKIGSLSPDAVAVHFGARGNPAHSREDIAAGLAMLTGQQIGLLAAHKYHIHECASVCILGRAATFAGVRRAIEGVLEAYDIGVHCLPHCERGTSTGALCHLASQFA